MSQKPLSFDPPQPLWFSSTVSFYLDWAIRLLSLTAALLFGIWAPLAYTATLVANRDADASQAVFSRRLDEIAAMQHTVDQRLHALEMLRVWEFCADMGRDLGACRLLGKESVERMEKVVGNAFQMPVAPELTGVVSSTVSFIVPRTMSITVTTIPTASASPTPSRPVIVGDPAPGLVTGVRGLGVVAGLIGIVALLAVIWMRSRSSVLYRAYHRV